MAEPTEPKPGETPTTDVTTAATAAANAPAAESVTLTKDEYAKMQAALKEANAEAAKRRKALEAAEAEAKAKAEAEMTELQKGCSDH